MKPLVYELRRLRGLRSTWLIVATVLVGDAAVTALSARHLPVEPLSVAAAVRAVTAGATAQVLPLPLAALGSALLGALSYGHEARYPGLPAVTGIAYRSRLRLLAGKLLVIGWASGLLALTTLALDAAVLRMALPAGADSAPVFTASALAAAARPLALCGWLTIVSGGAGLLVSSVVRSTVAGLLVVCSVRALLQPETVLAVLHAVGREGALAPWQLVALRYAFEWIRGVPQGTTEGIPTPLLPAVVLVPPVALAALALLAQSRRRAF